MTSYASADFGVPPRPMRSIKGRSSRKEYWISIAVLLGVQAARSVLLPKFSGLGIVATVMWVRIYTRRLHDLGQSGWMQCLLYGGQAFAVAAGLIWAWPEFE